MATSKLTEYEWRDGLATLVFADGSTEELREPTGPHHSGWNNMLLRAPRAVYQFRTGDRVEQPDGTGVYV